MEEFAPYDSRVTVARPEPPSSTDAARFSKQARKDTGPEVALRRLLHARGLRYRLHVPVPTYPRRTIDICFPRQRVAVFVDGCYWHGCPDHKGTAAHNAEWWATKLAGNRARDAETTAALRSAGWTVLRVWEHEAAETAAERVTEVVRVTTARPRKIVTPPP